MLREALNKECCIMLKHEYAYLVLNPVRAARPSAKHSQRYHRRFAAEDTGRHYIITYEAHLSITAIKTIGTKY